MFLSAVSHCVLGPWVKVYLYHTKDTAVMALIEPARFLYVCLHYIAKGVCEASSRSLICFMKPFYCCNWLWLSFLLYASGL